MFYKIAKSANDYKAVRALMLAEGQQVQAVTFPTILAFDDERLIGFIATTPDPDMVLGGPVVLAPGKQAPFVAARLAKLYQQVLLSMGVKHIVFYADENTSPFGRGMKRMFPHIEPYAKKGSVMFYNWPLEPELQRSA